MFYCYDERVPLEFYEKEIEVAKKKGQAIFYNDVDGFKDSFGNKIDIKDKVIIPRTFIAQIADINEIIEQHGGLLAVSEIDYDTILNWPKYYKTKRKTIILSGEDLVQENTISELEKAYGDKIFLKTKEKNFSDVIPISLLKDKECNFYKALLSHLDKDFIVSSAINILEDEFGFKEYRCFVLNDEVANISRYTKSVLHSVNQDILDRAKEIVAFVKGVMPSFYVVDLFEYEVDGHKEIDVVEFNPIQASGLYLYNSAIDVSEDILHKEQANLPFEYLDTLDTCSSKGSMFNEREQFYNASGSFANTLLGICSLGSPGIGFVRDITLNEDDYALHKPKIDLNSSMLVKTDLDLNANLLGKRLLDDDSAPVPKKEIK